MSGLHFDFTGNPAGLVNAAEKSRMAIAGITAEADRAGVSIDNFLGATKDIVTSMTGIGIGVAGLKSFGSALIDIRGEFQDTEARLKVFLKSEQAAADMMEELEGLAWNNTFEFSDVTKAAAQLLAFKTNAKDVGDTITRLSEIASGTGGSLADMVEKFNKVKSTGTMDSNMIQQFSNMGVDVKGILAELEGKNRSDYDGITLTFTDLQKVIHNLTDEGGQFFGMMKERGKNISDSVAGVRDNFALMMNDIGQSVQGPVKSSLDMTNKLMANWKDVAAAIASAVAALGIYKGAFATFEGIKAARQKINYQMEAKELESITKATQEAYKVEIEMLEQQIQAGTAARDADLQIAVAKGTLTEAQAQEITNLRELAAQQVNELTLKAQLAQAEAAAAAQELASLDNAANAKKYYAEEVAAIDAKIAALGTEGNARQLAALEQKKTIAQENLEIATRQANEAQTRRQAAAERAEAASKNAEGLAAQADAAKQGLDAVGKTVNTQQTKALTKAQMALKMVMESTGLSMLANPYILAAVAVAALCYGIYKLVTAETDAERAARRHTEELERQKNILEQVNSENKERVGVIQNRNSTVNQKRTAFSELQAGNTIYTDDEGEAYDEETQKIMNTAGQKLAAFYKTADALAAASRDKVEQLMNQFADETKIELAKDAMAKAEKEAERAQAAIDAANASIQYGGQGASFWDYRRLNKANQELEVARDVLEEIKKNQADAEWSKMSLADKQLDFETNLKPQLEPLKDDLDEAQKKVEELGDPHWWQFKAKADKADAERKVKELKAQIESIEDKEIQINVEVKNNSEDTTTNLAATIKSIRTAEREYQEAQRAYSKNASDANLEKLNKAKSNYDSVTKRYQNQTGKAWANSVQMAEERTKQLEKLALEETKIMNSSIEDQRKARKAEYDLTIQEIKNEEKEYKRAHNGRGSGTLDQKLSNAKMQFDIDIANLDRQWREWKLSKERETFSLKLDVEMEQLQRNIDEATTDAERESAKKAYRAKETERMVTDNSNAANDELKNKLGGDQELVNIYKELKDTLGDTQLALALGVDEKTISELREVETHYANILDLQLKQKAAARSKEDLDQQISDMTDFAQQSIAIEQERLDAIRDLEMTEMDPNERRKKEEEVNAVAAAKQAKLERDTGYDAEGNQGEEALARKMQEFGISLATATFDQIELLYQQYIDELSKQIEPLQQQNAAMDEYMANQSMLASGRNEEGGELTEEEKQALREREAELAAILLGYGIQLEDIDARRAQNAQKLLALNQSKKIVEEQYINASNKASKSESDQAIVSRARWNHSRTALKIVGDTAKQVSDTFGGYMSTKAKKALDAIATVSDVALNSIDAISTCVKSTSTAMQVSSAAAATSISTVEKASVILTIISAVIQAAIAIANLLGIKSNYEIAKERLDAQIERVEDAKEKQAELERIYKRSAGTKHYKEMAKAAQNYDEVIREQELAVKRAEEARDAAKSDDDKKEADKTLKEQQQALQELEDSKYELFEQMRQELLTTDVTSFSENLADALVEGFEDGTSSIHDVWENVLNDMMKAMMKKQLALALADKFDETFKKFNNYLDDGALTEAEMTTIMNEMDAKSKEAELIALQYQQMMEKMGVLDDSDISASSGGGMKSMSQETAEELNGRFTALQMTGASLLANSIELKELLVAQIQNVNSMLMQIYNNGIASVLLAADAELEQLRIIASNTGLLVETNRRLANIESKTDKL